MKVLIVDDNSANLYMLESLLKGYGYEVISAMNGRDALDKARLDPPDTVVTDILMPVMDGFTLCREWKSDAALRHIPLVFYTGTYTEKKDEEFAISLGADRFILKPQEPDVLMNILQEVLDKKYVAKQVTSKPLGEEMEFFRKHNEVLFEKIEQKMIALEIANQKLKTLEETYRVVFENVSDVIYTVDTNLIVTNVSPSVKRILGYEPEDFIGRPVAEMVHILTPESLERAITDIEKALNEEAISTVIYEFISKNGERKYGEVSSSPLVRNGKIAGVISLARDITERKHAEDMMRESEEKYRSIVETTTEWIWEMDHTGKHTYSNQKITDILGYGLEEFVGKNAISFMHEENRAEVERALPQLIAERRGWRGWVLRWRHRDGGYRFLESNADPVFDAAGQFCGFRGADRDITERRASEKAIEASEHKLKQFFENMSNCAAIYEAVGDGEDFIFKDFNRAAEEVEHTDRKDVIGRSVLQVFPGVRDMGMFEVFQRVWKTGKPEYTEATIYKDDRIEGWRENYIYKLPSGEIVAIYDDVTDRKRVEYELRESEKKYRELINGMNETVWVINLEGDIVDVNRAAVEMLGYSKEELFAIGLYGIDSSLKKEHINALVASMPSDKIQIFETSHRTKDGRVIPVEVYSSLVTYQGKKAILSIARDITERKRAEEQIKRSLREKESLLQEVHHRVKNNMQVIASMLSLQSDQLGDEKIVSILRDSENRVKSMALIHEKLYLSPDLSGVNFAEYVESLASHLFVVHNIDPNLISFVSHVVDILFEIETAIPCGLIVNELVTNALKYAFPQGRRGEITVDLHRNSDQTLALSVSDNGIGLPEDIDPQSTGTFGMQLVSILTDQLSGTLEIERTEGTTFRITFSELQYKKRI